MEGRRRGSVGTVEGQGEGSWGHDFKMVTSTSIVTLMRRGLGYVGQSRILDTRKKEGFTNVYLFKKDPRTLQLNYSPLVSSHH